MMKPRTFTWAWNDYAPQPDPTMTPERALKFFCAWRRGARNPRNGGPIFKVERLAIGRYRITSLNYGETATIEWKQAA